MDSPGIRLKRVRERLNLRYRDVEQASHEIARKHSRDEYIIALSRLADIENKGTLPTLYRLYSLCAIYRLNPLDVMAWYGLPLASLTEDSLLCPQPSTSLLPLETQEPLELKPFGLEKDKKAVDTPMKSKTTLILPRDAKAGGWIVQTLLGMPNRKSLRVGIIGELDDSMAPLLPPGSLVLIDDSRKKIARNGWKTENDRPIYFLETRSGFVCRWCNLNGGELMAIPHPSSTVAPERFRYPAEIEIVGEVAGLATPRLQSRSFRSRS